MMDDSLVAGLQHRPKRRHRTTQTMSAYLSVSGRVLFKRNPLILINHLQRREKKREAIGRVLQ